MPVQVKLAEEVEPREKYIALVPGVVAFVEVGIVGQLLVSAVDSPPLVVAHGRIQAHVKVGVAAIDAQGERFIAGPHG
ncbi:hypothetical protein D3C81_2231990 [compost metagenome]